MATKTNKGRWFKTRELAWAAGLFEGEGCVFSAGQNKYGYQYTALAVNMTDEDSVRRFAAAVGVGNVRGPILKTSAFVNKPVWEWRIANFEQVQAVIAMLWFGLGTRRRARATELLLSDSRRAVRQAA